MQINKWVGGETRYYFDLKFGGCKYLSRSENAALAGRWVGSDYEGNAVSFIKTSSGGGRCRGEEGKHIDKQIGIAGLTFVKFEEIYEKSLTPSGNFSETRFFKNLEPGH